MIYLVGVLKTTVGVRCFYVHILIILKNKEYGFFFKSTHEILSTVNVFIGVWECICVCIIA